MPRLVLFPAGHSQFSQASRGVEIAQMGEEVARWRCPFQHRELLARLIRGHVNEASQNGKVTSSSGGLVLYAAEVAKRSLKQNLSHHFLCQP